MDFATILAQVAENAAQDQQAAGGATDLLDTIWKTVTSLDIVESMTFLAFGVVCLFYGWRVFKILVMICFALLGLYAGLALNRVLVGGNGIWLGILCMALFTFFSFQMMRWGVSLLGAAAGGVLTGGIWYALGQPYDYIWIGALVGIVAGGMISFIIFKASIMLFTSMGGSALIVVGALALMHRYIDSPERIENLVFNHKWVLPVMLLVPMAAGVILQNKLIKQSKDWDI